MRLLGGAAARCLLAGIGLAASASAAPPAAGAHPDLSGFWSPARQQHPFDAALIARLPANTVILDDTGPAEFPQRDYGGLKVKPGPLADALKWKPEDEMTVARTCAAPSIVYTIQGPFPFEIVQTPQLIVFRYEYFDQVRLIFMDGRPHLPAAAPHSKTGDSIGHWEGGDLVIDTTHLSPATITNNGLNHSDKLHMVERYRLSADRKTLKATQWFEDPEVLDNNGARYIQWVAKPGDHVHPYDCDPSFALNYQSGK